MDGQNFWDGAPGHRHIGQDPLDRDRCTAGCPVVFWLTRQLTNGTIGLPGDAVAVGTVGSGQDPRYGRASWIGIDEPARG